MTDISNTIVNGEYLYRQVKIRFNLICYDNDISISKAWDQAISHSLRAHDISPLHAACISQQPPKEKPTPINNDDDLAVEFDKYVIEHKSVIKNHDDLVFEYSMFIEDMYYEGRVHSDKLFIDDTIPEGCKKHIKQ